MGSTLDVKAEAKRITLKIFMLQQVSMFTSALPGVFIIYFLNPVPEGMMLKAFLPVALMMPITGILLPYYTVLRTTRQALAVNPGDAAGARLARILKLPRLLELVSVALYVLGLALVFTWISFVTGNPYINVLWGCGAICILLLVQAIWTRIFIERMLMPLALEEFSEDPGLVLKEGGILWTKQHWNLPYSFALFIVATVVTLGTVVIRVAMSKYDELLKKLDPQNIELVAQSMSSLLGALWLPLIVLSIFMLVSASVSALLMARHQYSGFRAIQESIEGFVSGNPKQPEWVATDEIGDLSRITAQAFNKVRDFSLSLKKSASSLGGSAEILDQSNTAQNEVITRQAAALQEAQVTAQEIRHTSLLAAQKAEGVLQQTETMEQLGRNGEAAVSRSISSLEEIRGVVTEMATRIKSLDERARQIENITRTVKDLADQSNMLALNAAIEAVRSGEHGKGFGVVAREIRALADQSIKATARVQQILQDISSAIRSTVAMTDKGVERVGTSVEEVRAFGDSMQKLSSIMQDSTAAVRQISAAVSQQNQGITQIFDAIRDLNTVMNDTMVRLNKTNTVTMEVRGVATHVSELIASYGWEKTAWQEKAPDAE